MVTSLFGLENKISYSLNAYGELRGVITIYPIRKIKGIEYDTSNAIKRPI